MFRDTNIHQNKVAPWIRGGLDPIGGAFICILFYFFFVVFYFFMFFKVFFILNHVFFFLCFFLN